MPAMPVRIWGPVRPPGLNSSVKSLQQRRLPRGGALHPLPDNSLGIHDNVYRM
jgi:hypothetical protein